MQLTWRNIHRHRRIATADALIDPSAQMGERLKQRPCADRHDYAGLFGNRYEFGRRDVHAVFHVPAHQCFEADYIPQINIDYWLMHESKFASFERTV